MAFQGLLESLRFFFRGGIGRALQVEAVAYAKAWRFAKGKWKPGRPK